MIKLNDWLPESCPICGYFGEVHEFLRKGDKYHMRLVCPTCGASTDFYESLDEAFYAWMDGEIEEAAEDDR